MIADLKGQQFGNYRLLQLVGEGGSAQVYLGEHIHLGTRAAIKVLNAQLTHEDKERFRLEARTIARLEHPHIVRVFDFGVERNIPFLVMSYAPYGTLRQLHPKGTPVPLALVVSYFKQVADALQYAHTQRIIHRDIKPENLLLGHNNEILLSDFGIALVLQSSHSQSTKDMAGTISYMAPEQIEAHPRVASDQYSLAIVVYEWLSGERPFHGTWTEIAIKHSLAPPPSLREKVPTLASTIENVVFKALEKKPESRYPDVQAFAHALEQAYLVELSGFLLKEKPSEEQSIHFPREMLLPDESFYPLPSYMSPGEEVFLPSVPPTIHSQLLQATALPQALFSSADASLRSSVANDSSSKKRISRRQVVTGLMGLAIIGTGAAWFTRQQSFSQTPQTTTKNTSTSTARSQSHLTTTPEPTASHMGTVIGSSQLLKNSAQDFSNQADSHASILIHLPSGSFVAYESACTHEGVHVSYNPDTHMLLCPAHGSIFDPSREGAVVQGPAPTPLKQVAIQVNANGTITTRSS